MMPDPKVVVACGICACDGGIFKECYNILGGADKVVPVDVYVPGCAARPQAIIDGIVKGIGIFQERLNKMESGEDEKSSQEEKDSSEEKEEAGKEE